MENLRFSPLNPYYGIFFSRKFAHLMPRAFQKRPLPEKYADISPFPAPPTKMYIFIFPLALRLRHIKDILKKILITEL